MIETAASKAGEKPRLAILFWFYKAIPICLDRLTLLRRLNPDTPIYGLWGGGALQAEAQAELLAYLDDLYLFDGPESSEWRWRNGDLIIAAWAEAAGARLAWDTVVVVQWDMLMLSPVSELFGELERDQLLLSGLRPLEEVRSWWGWAGARDEAKGRELAAFRSVLTERFRYDGPLLACLFIVACLPRAFLQAYAQSGPTSEGFLEYKLPTMARVFGHESRNDPRFVPWWASDPETRGASPRRRALNAVGQTVALKTILRERAKPDGLRVFHPFTGRFPAWLNSGPGARRALAAYRLARRGR